MSAPASGDGSQVPDDAGVRPVRVREGGADGHQGQRWSCIPIIKFVRPCLSIPPSASDSDFTASVADTYRALTTELPLRGGPALMSGADGLPKLTATLRREAEWLEPAIRLVEEQCRLQLWAGRPWLSMRPLLLVGPPGCGKSSFARILAQASGCGHAVLDLAGTSDNRTLEGTARGWTGAQPCFAAIVMHQTRCANPVITLEEVDKAGGSARNGDAKSTLLTMTERSTAAVFYDKCLMTPFDLSHVCWVLTANSIDRVPAALLARLDVVEVGQPGPEHFDLLLARALRDLASRCGLSSAELPELPPRVVAGMRKAFAKRRSARQLARMVEAVVSAGVDPELRSFH